MRKGVIRDMVFAAGECVLLNTLKDFFLLMCLCVHISARDCGGRSSSDLLELELQAVVSSPVWAWEPNSGPCKSCKSSEAFSHRCNLAFSIIRTQGQDIC